MQLVVFKLGGSLLELPDLPQLLELVWSQRPQYAALIVVGGGAAADVVRDWDRAHALGDERAHWLALEALAFNMKLLRDLLPESVEVRERKEFEAAARSGATCLLHCRDYLRGLPPRTDTLPHTWDVTSDSIAAWVAAEWSAQELVLLKSVPLPAECSLAEAQAAGLVDRHFDQASAGLAQISWANLREPPCRLEPWLWI